jgi:hypothetical protein
VIDCKFVNGHIAGQIFLMNASKRAQEIAQTGPAAFIGIDMHFPNSIAIGIASPLILAVTDGMSYPLEFVVTIILIGVQGSLWLGELLYERTQRCPLRVFHDPHPNLTRNSALNGTNRRSIIGISAPSPSLISSIAGWVLRIRVPVTFFPRRSGTFHRFRLPDRQGGSVVGLVQHWLAVGAGLRSLWSD